jgi:hypothetical protein
VDDQSAGITYSLTNKSDSGLSIDSSTGAVTLTAALDAEVESIYSFTVVATDGVNSPVERSVTVNVNDLDDEAPTITSATIADAIDENSGAGQIIYTATADDSGDDVSDTPIIFSLAGGSDPALTIDETTGAVILNTNPDHENQSQVIALQ